MSDSRSVMHPVPAVPGDKRGGGIKIWRQIENMRQWKVVKVDGGGWGGGGKGGETELFVLQGGYKL